MAEIHDQFDTILILDFGSQVRSCRRIRARAALKTTDSTATSSRGDVAS
jgi:hypothetical protein